jgi:hypothetical protein
MAAGPDQPPSPEQPPGTGSGERGSQPPHSNEASREAVNERYGPLELTRLRKDDGRALILYSHDEGPPPQASDDSASEPNDGRDRA